MNEARQPEAAKKGKPWSAGELTRVKGSGPSNREGISLLRMLIQFENYDGVMTIS